LLERSEYIGRSCHEEIVESRVAPVHR
jgi:hypothetical protein